MSNLLSIQEAADVLKLHPETLRRWDREGKLKAIKVGERGDRYYRYQDLLKMKAGFEPTKYQGFDIIPHSIGFENPGGTLIRIASFIVRKDDNPIAVFAFTDGGVLIHMSHPHLNDEYLLNEVKKIINNFIDNKKIKHLEEYTFEFHQSNYIQVIDPKWWTKTLKEIYG
jgi:excisionase family DNA binding protein